MFSVASVRLTVQGLKHQTWDSSGPGPGPASRPWPCPLAITHGPHSLLVTSGGHWRPVQTCSLKEPRRSVIWQWPLKHAWFASWRYAAYYNSFLFGKCIQYYFYRPQRSCGQGNVFTGVCLSTGGRVSASVHVGMPDPPGPGRPPPDQADTPWTRQTPQTRQTPGPSRHPPPGSRLQHTVYERPVLILLECILVRFMFLKFLLSFHLRHLSFLAKYIRFKQKTR